MLSKKMLITGCGGMLGNAIYPFFLTRYETVLATDRDVNEDWLMPLDVRDDRKLGEVFEEYRPDVVVHLAAETSLEYCETYTDIAEATNARATRTIAELCRKREATLIYVSTAGVFDGSKEGEYIETDRPNPIMVYGKTKFDGELYASKHCEKTFVVRAGWMMGGGRKKEKKFVYKILQQIGSGQREIFAVDDLWGTPTYTNDFAQTLFLLMETENYGTYHMVCGGKGTRYDVAREILEICNRTDIKLTRVGSEFFKEEYFVTRPRSEMMYNHNLTRIGCNHMRSWRDALHAYIKNDFHDYINNNGGDNV